MGTCAHLKHGLCPLCAACVQGRGPISSTRRRLTRRRKRNVGPPPEQGREGQAPSCSWLCARPEGLRLSARRELTTPSQCVRPHELSWIRSPRPPSATPAP